MSEQFYWKRRDWIVQRLWTAIKTDNPHLIPDEVDCHIHWWTKTEELLNLGDCSLLQYIVINNCVTMTEYVLQQISFSYEDIHESILHTQPGSYLETILMESFISK